MRHMRNTLILGLVLAAGALAGSAKAQETCVGSPDPGECPQTAGAVSTITTDTVWGSAAFPCPIILNEPVFVTGGATLTINAGCVVRGQTRQAAVQSGVTAGTPGTLIVTQTGKINAVGTREAPIIFTTAAIDNDNDGAADAAGFDRAPYGGQASGDVFLDDAPLVAPLAPLNALGVENTDLWGGVVILGNAPTNLADLCGVGHGKCTVEGLTFPGYPASVATYGGVNPHDSSGRLVYFSIRHGGDEIGESNELNCLSMGGVGDGTEIAYGDCYVNFDDGFEFFGGTVDTHHLMASYIGDDLFDLDEGFTGIGQFWFGIQGAFNEGGGSTYGSKSGDKLAEFDGDNYNGKEESPAGQNVNCSTRFQVPGTNAPAPLVEDTPWPLSNPHVYNFTLIGPGGAYSDGFANPAVSPLSASAVGGKKGMHLRHGFAGRLFNGMVVNTLNGAGAGPGISVENGGGGCPGFDAVDNANAGLIVVGTTTLDDVAPPSAATQTALNNGDAVRVSLGAVNNANSLNCVNTAYLGLTSENTLIEPTGGADGKLDALATPIDPRPRFGTCGANGVPPQHPGVDRNATYRGAFQGGAPLWTDRWTALDRAGVL